ncbi:hypothetical protein CRD_02853 [Raphidiopsis brookii D9]|nr:hypothetical protein CRD_02853 [Raphidiopsis brookii D9]
MPGGLLQNNISIISILAKIDPFFVFPGKISTTGWQKPPIVGVLPFLKSYN